MNRPLAIATLALVGTLLTALSAHARVPCGDVERLGNLGRTVVLSKVNGDLAGTRHRINRRKTLVLHSAEQLSFQGCKATVKVRSTLERKIRRNASGTFTATADVHVSKCAADGSCARICLRSPKVTRIDLGNTLEFGEAFYERAANKAIKEKVWKAPDSVCRDVAVPPALRGALR